VIDEICPLPMRPSRKANFQMEKTVKESQKSGCKVGLGEL